MSEIKGCIVLAFSSHRFAFIVLSHVNWLFWVKFIRFVIQQRYLFYLNTLFYALKITRVKTQRNHYIGICLLQNHLLRPKVILLEINFSPVQYTITGVRIVREFI